MTDTTTHESDEESETLVQSEEQGSKDPAQTDGSDRWEHPGVGKIPGARNVR